MRDVNKKILFIMWAVVAVFLIVILATRTAPQVRHDGSGDGMTITIGSSRSIVIPAASEDFNKVYTFTANDFRNIEVSLVSADMLLEPTDGSEIVVAVNGTGWHPENEPIVSFERMTLSVKSQKNAEVNKSYQGNRIVTVKVPSAFLNTLFDADIETVSGSIKSAGISYESLDAESVSGDIKVTGTVKEAECESVSGDISLETEVPLTGESSFGSVSGNVSLTLPEDSSFYMEWQTLSGSVRNDFAGGKCAKKGTLDMLDGKPEIELETVSGNICVFHAS